MTYIPDPIELIEMAEERQFDLIDKNMTYPCVICGRRFPIEEMHPVSEHPAASLECGLLDCSDK